MAATEHGFAGIVTALLAAGATPELADTRGRTALMLACVKVGIWRGSREAKQRRGRGWHRGGELWCVGQGKLEEEQGQARDTQKMEKLFIPAKQTCSRSHALL